MKPESKIKLDLAELFYKFSLGVKVTIDSANDKVLTHYGVFAYLKHSVDSKEIELTRDEEEFGAYLQEQVGTYMLILQLDKVLEDEWGTSRIYSKNSEIRKIFRVVRLIRNAFAHDPFKPIWRINSSWRGETYEIPGILTMKTEGLHGNRLKWKKDEKGKRVRRTNSTSSFAAACEKNALRIVEIQELRLLFTNIECGRSRSSRIGKRDTLLYY
jgi:hypothetical protein